jgi:hypothetical protein
MGVQLMSNLLPLDSMTRSSVARTNRCVVQPAETKFPPSVGTSKQAVTAESESGRVAADPVG